jgi:hypothetical protein
MQCTSVDEERFNRPKRLGNRGREAVKAALLRGGALASLLVAWTVFSWVNQSWELVNPVLMGEFVEFLYKLNRIPQKFDPGSVFYTKLLEELDPALVKWRSTVALK